MQSPDVIFHALMPREYTEVDVMKAVAIAKRDLADKVLAAIEGVNPRLNGPAMRQVITEELNRVFTESGVEVETKRP
jgi:hypothetical protein